MKRKLKILISLVLVCTFMLSTVSFASPINVYYNNEKMYIKPSPVIQNERTLVPIRALLEINDFDVGWDNNTRTVNISKDSLDIKLTVGSKVAKFIEYREDLGKEVSRNVNLDTAATIINGSTYVPLRFISEAMGTPVEWHQDSNSILLRSEYPDNIEGNKPDLNSWLIKNQRTSFNLIDSIGKSKKEIIRILGNDYREDKISNPNNIMYNDWPLIHFDDSDYVSSLYIMGDLNINNNIIRKDMTFDEVEDILGKSLDKGFSQDDQEYYISYKVGSITITFLAEREWGTYLFLKISE